MDLRKGLTNDEEKIFNSFMVTGLEIAMEESEETEINADLIHALVKKGKKYAKNEAVRRRGY